ncbi:transcriptional regulator [Kitasatospora aureofaciens]|uniref:Transcriptional regulator n=2 Tax=Kitasatospora aureofaciens TaxID=1894 RepID=A0A8H9HMM6_KITAU|nr:transcriptional regulator [Kitasatospora aureofaciens]
MNASSSATPPPMSWQYCGNQIKLWRARAGVSREDLAAEARYSYESLRSMEAGRRKPSPHLLQVADEMCDAKGILVAGVQFLKPEKYPHFAEDYMRYEAEAVVIHWYETLLIPGLLQTEETARTLLHANWPPLDDDTIEERVTARLERQEVLKTQTKSFNFLIGEAALRNPLASEVVHKCQLLHLLAVGSARHIVIQVVPGSGAHTGLNGPFILLDSDEHQRLAYEEGQAMGLLHSDPGKVSLLSQRHAMILQRALSPEASAEFIGKLAEDL